MKRRINAKEIVLEQEEYNRLEEELKNNEEHISKLEKELEEALDSKCIVKTVREITFGNGASITYAYYSEDETITKLTEAWNKVEEYRIIQDGIDDILCLNKKLTEENSELKEELATSKERINTSSDLSYTVMSGMTVFLVVFIMFVLFIFKGMY